MAGDRTPSPQSPRGSLSRFVNGANLAMLEVHVVCYVANFWKSLQSRNGLKFTNQP